MKSLLPLVAVAALALGLPAAASHCPQAMRACGGHPCLGVVVVGDGTEEGTYYVDDRNYLLGEGIWFYEESNGLWTGTGPEEDYQPGGCSDVFADSCDPWTCPLPPGFFPDRLLF